MLCVGKSDIGKKRSVNQDSFLYTEIDCGKMLAVVCDGMGGAAGGGVAGSLACKTYTDYVRDRAGELLSKKSFSRSDEKKIKNVLCDAVTAANSAVNEKAVSDISLRGMGTTLVSTLAAGDTLYTANVGDSRMYLITEGSIRQITHDHSYVQYLVDSGRMTADEAKKSIGRNIITRAVGTDKTVSADIFVTPVPKNGGLVLLCTDGLVNHVHPERIYDIIKEHQTDDTELFFSNSIDALIREANAAGGSDNITAVLMAV